MKESAPLSKSAAPSGADVSQDPAFVTKTESVVIAGVANLEIRSLLDRQQYCDPRLRAQQQGISSANWSLFGLVWPSSAQLAARMASRALVASERILELGCGLALPSLVAHRRGADVTASDRHPLTAGFLRHNLRLNQLRPMKYRHGNWRQALGSRALREDGFDFIVGSDLLYERDVNGDLASMIERNARRTAQVWIADPDRGNRAAFGRRMADFGFASREERLDRSASPHAAAYKGRLLVFTRSSAT